MRRTKQPGRWHGASWALRLGVLLVGLPAGALAEPPGGPPPAESPPPTLAGPPPVVEETLTACGSTPVGAGAGQLRALGHGFYAEGARVRRGCTLLLQRPLRDRPAVPFAPESFKPLGCGFFRYATSIFWYQPLTAADTATDAAAGSGGERADVLTRLDLADAATFEVGADCQPRDARFFYLNDTATPALPAFVAVPRDEGAGYEELGCGFVRYAGRIFFGVQLVEGAHAPSFTSVQGRLPSAECGEGPYGKDRIRVWWRQEPVRGASAKLFRVPRENNPDLRVGCSGPRSFLLGAVEKKPHPACVGLKKGAKPGTKRR